MSEDNLTSDSDTQNSPAPAFGPLTLGYLPLPLVSPQAPPNKFIHHRPSDCPSDCHRQHSELWTFHPNIRFIPNRNEYRTLSQGRGTTIPRGKDERTKSRIRLDLEGYSGLPRSKTSSQDPDIPRSYVICFDTGLNFVTSSVAIEGKGSLQGTLQWNQTLYLEALEFGDVDITLRVLGHADFVLCRVRLSMHELISTHEISTWAPDSQPQYLGCTLFLRASEVPPGGDKQRLNPDSEEPESDAEHPIRDVHVELIIPVCTWDTVFCQLPSLAKTVSELKTSIDSYGLQLQTHRELQQAYDPHINELLTTVAKAVDVVLQLPYVHLLQRKDCIAGIMYQLHLIAFFMDDLSMAVNTRDRPYSHDEEELARLTVIIVTPSPTAGASSLSPGAEHQGIFKEIAKDALICALDALAQSADACGPVKSAAGGLMFFVTWADLVSSNKKDIGDLCDRISSLVGYFKLVITDGAPLTAALDNTIKKLASDIAKLNAAVEEIAEERKSRLRRYISAKQHRKKLEGVARKLDEARGNYTAAVVTLNATTIADVRAHVQAYTLLVGTTPIHAPEMRRAEAGTFPFSTARIKEA